MDFSTLDFWLSLIPVFLALWAGNLLLAKKPRVLRCFHKCLMLTASLVLLGMTSRQTLAIFLSVMLLAWGGCKTGLCMGVRGRKILLGLLVPLLLAPLFFYKYSYFVGGSILQQEWDTLRHLVIPVGLSFYTFQMIGFCIDTLLRKEPMPKFIDYMNFGSFFPQIVAGPIERRSDLLPQMQELDLSIRKVNWEQGIPYVILGLFFKLVLADNLATAFFPMWEWEPFLLWMQNLNFAFRIYFDFAGYGLTAYGLARCLGITLQMNFLSPYTAANITEFWRRWHITLTGWFRDYIYFPMGGSRTRRWAVNIVFVFFVSGIWHGAGWNFMIWGTLSGVAMVIHRVFRKREWKLPAFVGWLATFVYMVFVWMFFCDTDMSRLGRKLELLFSPDRYNWGRFISGILQGEAASSIAVPFLLLSFAVIFVEYLSQKKKGDPYELFLSPAACGAMVAMMFFFVPMVHNQFIYFAF